MAIRLEDAEPGRRVIYTPDCRRENRAPTAREVGTISSSNARYVFVRYGTSQTAEATNPLDLDFEFAPAGTP
jgi:hypothetical protein